MKDHPQRFPCGSGLKRREATEDSMNIRIAPSHNLHLYGQIILTILHCPNYEHTCGWEHMPKLEWSENQNHTFLHVKWIEENWQQYQVNCLTQGPPMRIILPLFWIVYIYISYTDPLLKAYVIVIVEDACCSLRALFSFLFFFCYHGLLNETYTPRDRSWVATKVRHFFSKCMFIYTIYCWRDCHI